MMIIEFIITSAVLTLMPGPDIIFVVTQSALRGRKAGLSVAMGLSSGLFIHSLAVAFGLSLIISSSPDVFTAIKYAGVAFLIYMGFMSLKTAKSTANNPEKPEQQQVSVWKSYRTGIMMNLLNPKVIIFFLALFPQFIDKSSSTPKTDVMILGAIFASVAIIVFSSVALVSDFVASRFSVKKSSPKLLAWIKASIYWLIAVMFLFY